MRILLGSGGFRTPERIQLLNEAMDDFFQGVEHLLFIPYALADHDRYVQVLTEKGISAGRPLVGIQTHPDAIEAVHQAKGIFVGGGNTFRLLSELYHRGLLGPIRQRVRAGLPYLGVSAGCNVACPTIRTTNDMPITQPPNLDALALVPFQVNPHYYTGQAHVKTETGYAEHYGETRDERIAEFHEMNDTPVVGLWEAGLLRIEGTTVELSVSPARVFRKGQPSVEVSPPARLDELLSEGVVAYTVEVTFAQGEVAEEWLRWLHDGHLAAVISGGAIRATVEELDVPSGRAFAIRYTFASRAAFGVYERDHASGLRAEGLRLFGPERGVSYRRTVGVMRAEE